MQKKALKHLMKILKEMKHADYKAFKKKVCDVLD